jgi:hypothetical protein
VKIAARLRRQKLQLLVNRHKSKVAQKTLLRYSPEKPCNSL